MLAKRASYECSCAQPAHARLARFLVILWFSHVLYSSNSGAGARHARRRAKHTRRQAEQPMLRRSSSKVTLPAGRKHGTVAP
jgi:hypothetical protein